MANENLSEQPQSNRRWLRVLGLVAGGLFVLLVVLYFVVSSSAFLKGVIMPRVGQAMHAQVTVSNASLSPFSQLTLDQLKVQPNGAEPLLTADQVRVRYSLLSILRGHYVVNELSLVNPVIQVVKDANGASNLDPITKGSEPKAASSKSEAPLRLEIRNVALKNATIRSIERAKDGSSKTTALNQLDLTLDQLANGGSGKLTIATGLRMENQVPAGKAGATNGLLEGKINGSFDYKLSSALMPESVKGTAHLVLSRTDGAYSDLAGLGGALDVEMTPTDVRQLALRFDRQGQALGSVQVSGPLDLVKSEGRLALEVRSIDRQVLNLFGASHGWDFGNSTINSTNQIDIVRQGTIVAAKGQFAARQVSVRQQGTTTPAVDVDIDYDVNINRPDEAAVLNKITITGRQGQTEILHASLDRPMTVKWAANARGLPASQFQLALSKLNLADWRPVLGTNVLAGQLDLNASVSAQNDNGSLAAKGQVTVQNFSAQFGTNRIDQTTMSVNLDGTLQNLNVLDLTRYALEVRQGDQALAKANGSAHYDLARSELNLQATAELVLPALLRQMPIAQLSAANGLIRFTSAITQKNQKQTLSGSVSLADFTGHYGAYAFENYQVGLDYGFSLDRPALEIQSASISVRNGYAAGGTMGLTGKYDLDKHILDATFKVVDLNQNALGPILAPSLGDKKLVSLSLSGGGTASYDPKGDASLKADLGLTNWVVNDPKLRAPSPALSVQTSLDGSMRQQILDLRQLLLRLSPTARAKNELSVTAHLDLGKTNATPSQLKVEAESLDLTPYYDLFAGAKQTNTPAAPPAPAPASEPQPASLPLEQLSAEMKVGRLYLRDLAITNLQSSIKVNKGEIMIKPFQLTLNGAPVSADAVVNTAVAGYTYNLSLHGDRIPLAPLITTFGTNNQSQLQGELIAQAQINGAGITDPSLQKNLSGNLVLNLTNMNYEVVGPKLRRLLDPISLVLRVPELMQTPLSSVGAKASVGKGQIELQQFSVLSQAFQAESHGTIPMAQKLTNSPLNLPVMLSLRQSLAQRANLVPPNTPTNATYVPLPAFVTLTGTLGDPKSEINKLVIGGLLARSIGGIGGVGGKAGNLIQGVGGLLSGQASTGANTNGPAGAATNSTAALVQGIGNLLGQSNKKAAPTNAPATVNTNKPARPNALDLLNLIPEKK